MGVDFAQPLWLGLALVALPTCWAALRWLRSMSGVRAASAGLLRLVVIALIAAMLAGATAVRRTDRMATIVVVDVSESVRTFAGEGGGAGGEGNAAAEEAARWIERAGAGRDADELLGVVVFDGRSVAALAPTSAEVEGLELRGPRRAGTDIGEALRYAAAMFPPGAARRLVLVSDGNETAGDALAAAREVGGGATPTPIDALPFAYRVANEVVVEAVDAPPTGATGQTVPVRVTLSSTGPARGEVRVFLEGQPVDLNGAAPGFGDAVEIGAGRSSFTYQARLTDRPVHRWSASFEGAPGADTVTANNRGEAFTVSPGKGAVLLVDGVSDGDPGGAGSTLASALRSGDLEVEVISPGMAPVDPLTLHSYSLVILQNVAKEEMSPRAQELLASYVHDLGGGLVMVGGEKSFGAGGWKGSPIEDVLPVNLDLPEQMILPPAALAIVLDSSGSMGAGVMGGLRSQQQIANEGAAQAILSLDSQDLVAVIEFDESSRIVVPLGPNDDPERSARMVRAISPGGGTNMYPALASAGRLLASREAGVKHVIVLSDGQSQGDPGQGIETAELMAQAGITVSTIAVGDSADIATMRQIAQAGGGEFYEVRNPSVLPRIFLRETRVVRKPLVKEQPFDPVVTASGSPVTMGMGTETPTLRGIVLTQARRDPNVVNAMLTPDGEPLLAHWNIGLGRAGAWTSDAHRWAEPWLGWPGYARMWLQLARTMSRPESSRNLELTMAVDGDELSLALEAYDDEGRPMDAMSVPGVVYTPGGETREISLRQVGPGRYEARAPATESGQYFAALTPRLGERAIAPVVGGATRAVGPELRSLRSNVGLLRRITEETGGRLLSWEEPETANLFERTGTTRSEAATALWPALLAWCLGFYLLDVGTRRIAWDRLLSARARGELATGAARRGEEATAALRRARERAAGRGRAAGKDEAREPAREVAREVARAAAEESRGAREAPKPAAGANAGESGASNGDREGGGEGEAGGVSRLAAAKRRARERYQDGGGSVE